MAAIQAGMSIHDPRVTEIDTSKLKKNHVSEMGEGDYQRFVETQEMALKLQYSTAPDTSGNPSYEDYATVEVGGKVVATIDNHGFVSSSNAAAGRFSGEIPNDVNGQNGPVLAQARAEKIAALLGGEVVIAASALSQQQFKAIPEPQVQVDYKAMMNDPAYTQLQKTKEARALFVAQDVGRAQASSVALGSLDLDTNNGHEAIDLDDHFYVGRGRKVTNLEDVPLLMPTKHNIDSLAEHVSGVLKTLMSDYGIPEHPEEITYDNSGHMLLPYDYQYADQFNQMIEENPSVGRELSTVNALTSHYVEMQKSVPFIEEMASASSSAEEVAIVEKYMDLLTDNNDYSRIVLSFDGNGDLRPMADGKDVSIRFRA
jgi:hypothetical protein